MLHQMAMKKWRQVQVIGRGEQSYANHDSKTASKKKKKNL